MAKKILAMTAVLVFVFVWFKIVGRADDQRMQMTYCWDASGQHYVAPDVHCSHYPLDYIKN